MPANTTRPRVRIARTRPDPAPPHVYRWWLWSGRPTFEGVCDALAQQYAVLDGLLQPLLAAGTNVAPLDRRRVAALIAQLTAVADQVVAAAQDPPGPPSGLDAVDWYRRRDPGDRTVADQVVTRADPCRTRRIGTADLAVRHRTATATAAAVVRSGEPNRVLGGPADGLDLAEFAVTRLVEAVVHGLDLADALGQPGCADPTAMHLVSGFLAVAADRSGTRPLSAPIAVDRQGALIVLTSERRKARIPAVTWIQAAAGRRPAEDLLPRSHDWLIADLPLVA